MLRRLSSLLAIFLLSATLTRAGFAGAAGSSEHAVELDSRSSGPVLDAVGSSPEGSLVDPFELASEPAEAPAWPARIEDKLEALERARGQAVESVGSVDTRRWALLAAKAELAAQSLDGRAAVELRDLHSGAAIMTLDGQRPLNPASNQKLITAIAAVELLGPDYTFETEVLLDGDALVLRGHGDPDLHVRDLHALAAVVVAKIGPNALAEVRRLVFDDSAFDGQRFGPGFRREGASDSYIAPSGALALDYGTLTVHVAPGRFGRHPSVHIEPAGAGVIVENNAQTRTGSLLAETRGGAHGRMNNAQTRTGSLLAETRGDAHGRTVVEIHGSIPGGRAPQQFRLRVSDPGLVAAGSFAQILAEQAGTDPLPLRRGQPTRGAELVARHRSAPLVSVLTSALRYSNNFTAEQVLRTMAWRASGHPGSWDRGVAVLDRFAAAVSPVHASRQRFINGSGLTRDGRLSPTFVVDVLGLSEREGSPAQLLLASFAHAGGEGTLRNRLSYAGARVVAKTGTYAGASSLSGIVRSRDGRARIGFSILVNGAPVDAARAGQDRVVAAILRALP